MLTYFFIIWIVSFFALCSPLLFITADDKKIYKNRYDTPIDEMNFSLQNKKDNIVQTIDNKKNSVTLSTGVLNIIFLLILPYIICATLDFSFFSIVFIYIIIIIIISGLRIFFSQFRNLNQFFLFIILMAIPFFPGMTLTEIFLR